MQSHRQFNLRHLFLCISAFAFSFGLCAAAIASSSEIFAIAAIVVFGTTIGGTIGLLLGGKGGAVIGALLAFVVVFYVVMSIPALAAV
jgi:hypothetical protein